MTSGEPRLWSAYRELTKGTVRTDLTHAFRPGQPHFAGFDATPALDDVRAGSGATAGSHPGRSSPCAPGGTVAGRTRWRRPTGARRAPVTPGWSAEVLTYLFEDAGVTAIGHEQADTDPGAAAPQATTAWRRTSWAATAGRSHC
jgi:kynurenine formamidase